FVRLCVEQAGVRRQTGKFRNTAAWSLHNKAAVIQQESAQTREFLTATCPPGATVQAAWYDVPVPCLLSTHGRVHNHDAPVQIADPKHNVANEGRVVGKDRRHKRA